MAVPAMIYLMDVVLTWRDIKLEWNPVPVFLFSTLGNALGFLVWALTYLIMTLFVAAAAAKILHWGISIFYGLYCAWAAASVATHFLAFLADPWMVQTLWSFIPAIVGSSTAVLHLSWVAVSKPRKQQ